MAPQTGAGQSQEATLARIALVLIRPQQDTHSHSHTLTHTHTRTRTVHCVRLSFAPLSSLDSRNNRWLFVARFEQNKVKYRSIKRLSRLVKYSR